jgi:hypothetical protein
LFLRLADKIGRETLTIQLEKWRFLSMLDFLNRVEPGGFRTRMRVGADNPQWSIDIKKTVRLSRRPTSCQGKPSELLGGEDMSELLLSSMSGTFVPYGEIWASEMPLFSNVA